MSGPSADFAAEKDRDSRQSPARVVRGTALATATFPPSSVRLSLLLFGPTDGAPGKAEQGKKETRETRSEGGGERAISAMEADEWP